MIGFGQSKKKEDGQGGRQRQKEGRLFKKELFSLTLAPPSPNGVEVQLLVGDQQNPPSPALQPLLIHCQLTPDLHPLPPLLLLILKDKLQNQKQTIKIFKFVFYYHQDCEVPQSTVITIIMPAVHVRIVSSARWIVAVVAMSQQLNIGAINVWGGVCPILIATLLPMLTLIHLHICTS
ncbi:hypothetical protein T439DRAFT_337818 [Meredithblackwellia eburnea MCA 4105]